MKFAAALLLALMTSPLAAQTPAAAAPVAKPAEFNPAGGFGCVLFRMPSEGAEPEVFTYFDVEVAGAPGALTAKLLNGSEQISFSSAEYAAGELSLALDHYDARVRLRKGENPPAGAQIVLAGVFERGTRHGDMSLSAGCTDRTISKELAAQRAKGEVKIPAFDLSGPWVFSFDKGEDGKPSKEVVPLRQKENNLEGTVAYVSGDLGNVAGLVGDDGGFMLYRFDAVHLVTLAGKRLPDGSLKGQLLINGQVSDFTATREGGEKALASLEATAESYTKLRDPKAVFHFHGKDLTTGKSVSEVDYLGKPVIVDIMGTWCPNCHDEAPVLSELAKKYAAEGLNVVALSFESDDEASSGRLIGIFKKKYGAAFPILYAGSSDDAAKNLADIDGLGAFPTTLFIDRKGHVAATHAGFEGAATGQLEALKARFDELARKLLQ